MINTNASYSSLMATIVARTNYTGTFDEGGVASNKQGGITAQGVKGSKAALAVQGGKTFIALQGGKAALTAQGGKAALTAQGSKTNLTALGGEQAPAFRELMLSSLSGASNIVQAKGSVESLSGFGKAGSGNISKRSNGNSTTGYSETIAERSGRKSLGLPGEGNTVGAGRKQYQQAQRNSLDGIKNGGCRNGGAPQAKSLGKANGSTGANLESIDKSFGRAAMRATAGANGAQAGAVAEAAAKAADAMAKAVAAADAAAIAAAEAEAAKAALLFEQALEGMLAGQASTVAALDSTATGNQGNEQINSALSAMGDTASLDAGAKSGPEGGGEGLSVDGQDNGANLGGIADSAAGGEAEGMVTAGAMANMLKGLSGEDINVKLKNLGLGIDRAKGLMDSKGSDTREAFLEMMHKNELAGAHDKSEASRGQIDKTGGLYAAQENEEPHQNSGQAVQAAGSEGHSKGVGQGTSNQGQSGVGGHAAGGDNGNGNGNGNGSSSGNGTGNMAIGLDVSLEGAAKANQQAGNSNVFADMTAAKLDAASNNVAARQAFSAPQIDKSALYAELEKGARIILDGDKSEMTMQLKPESLGRVMLKVITENGLVNAKFTVESEQAKQALESNIQELKETLLKQGMSVQDCTVQVGQENKAGWFADDKRSNGNRARSGENAVGTMAVVPGADTGRLAALRNMYFGGDSSVQYTA